MTDQSHLDDKYFIDDTIYNCPFCNRRHVSYSVENKVFFNWSNSKGCDIWLIKCESCEKISMHLSHKNLQMQHYGYAHLDGSIDLDSLIFYSVPTSFFVIDERIPKEIRELISEGEGCQKMNYLTGGSACIRKAIYELLTREETIGENYDDKIKDLKEKHPEIDPELFDVLGMIKDMTSDKVHEQSWEKWESGHLTLFTETLKTILHEIYVVPDEKEQRKKAIHKLRTDHGLGEKPVEQENDS